MPKNPSQFENSIVSGTTSAFQGPTNATPDTVDNVPSVAGNLIQKFELVNESETTGDDIQVSMDGGTTFFTVEPDKAYEWEPKNIRQLEIKSPVASVPYQITIDFEDY